MDKYSISSLVGTLLTESIPQYEDKLVVNNATGSIKFNENYQPSSEFSGDSATPKAVAEFGAAPNNSVRIDDIENAVSLTFTPKFKVESPRKYQNKVIYPISNINAAKVYTTQGTGIKEDIILFEKSKNELKFEYDISLSDGLEMRMEGDGSLGVYGPSGPLIGSNISTGSDKDAELLKAARDAADKNHLLFRIPAPFIIEAGKKPSGSAKSWYGLKDNVLTVYASGLDTAKYPLSIDPTVYIETAQKLMRGNNETNIEFDVTNELIQKGRTTGARFDSWNSTLATNSTKWNSATAVAGGFVYQLGGAKSDVSMYTIPGTSQYVVPAGVTSITLESWGGGAGGGGSALDRAGGDGGGGGYAAATITVTPGEVLTINVGGGGLGGRYSGPDVMGNGGAGGGYSGVFRSTTPLLIAGAGGGGGGANGDTASAARTAGSAGGAGGGSGGVAGSGNGSTTGGGAGSSAVGGAAGTSTTSGGTAGTSLQGGSGASISSLYNDTTVNGGGSGGFGQTGTLSADKRPGGGGGGAGYFGGGGGGRANADYNGGAGGGGGSGYVTGTLTSNTAGSGTTPGNSVDSDRNGAGSGGAGGVAGPNNGTSGSAGIVVINASGNNAAATGDLQWARFNTSSQAIQTTNPGTGNCTNWCTSSTYDLPSSATLAGHSLVAYNGFLYALGGSNSAGTRQNTVYVAKLGVNGEPSLWHPTDTNKANWVYWYSSASTLTNATNFGSAVAYNNRLYFLGGQTDVSGTNGVTAVYYTDVKPTGDIGAWTTTNMVVLPSARHNQNVHIYNDRMYLIGGATSNTTASMLSSVHYIKMDNDGKMSGSWIATSSFATARIGLGGSISTVWGGYIYISGGCSALTSGYCATVASDVQLASINADGSLTDWKTILGVTNQRTGHSLVAWRGALYGIGGCRSQNTGTGACTWGTSATDYGLINTDGDASTVSNSVPSGVAPCSGVNPYDCDTPPEGTGNGQGGRMSGATIVNNGYIYYFGGCHTAAKASICFVGAASKTSDNIYYASIAVDGSITKPATCVGVYYGSWCVDNTNTIPTGGIAGMAVAVFNNVVYLVGGTDGADWKGVVYRVGLNNDGSLAGAWTTQTFTNLALGAERGYSYAFSRSNPSLASTYPGNLYVIGGCAGSPITDNGVDCTDVQYTEVYKCNIMATGALEEADANDCDTTNQLQIDSEATVGLQGLGAMAGTVYANYIYLIGGQSPAQQERGSILYAKIDSSNNIVAVSGSNWVTAANSLNPVRRRGVAFGYNGYLYALAGYNSGNTLNDLLFAKIDVSDGSIGTFNESAVTVNPRWDLRAVVNNGYVYALGGCSNGTPPQDCDTMTGTVQTFQLYNNYSGSPSAFTSGTQYATNASRIGVSTAVLNGYMYVAGGCVSTTDCTDATNNVQYASIGTDGVLGTWASTTNALPADRAWGQLEVAGGNLYYLGGQGDIQTDEQSTIYYVGTFTSGNITAVWSTASGGIGDTASQVAQERTKFSSAVWNDRIYIVGGLNVSAVSTNTIYISPQLTSGGNIAADSWTSDADTIAVSRSGHVTIAYANNLYVIGGFDGTNYLNDVQYTQINTDGSTDAWSYSSSLPGRLRQADGFASNGYMYLLGGRSADTTCVSNTIVAPISANTTIASGNNPTGVGEWFETNVKYTGDRYGGGVSYYEGKMYVVGGGCGATVTYATGTSQTQQTTVQSQPQIAKYSRMIDTDTDVFPTYWLMNGLDNSIGARWYMKYRSMNDIDGVVSDCGTADMSTWGQETNYGQITLGDVATYTPKDGSGNNINCARYYYFSVSIDSSKAYGYPEDVNRGPTIADLSLFFTSDPSKRLRHGKTFTGGEQQPLDTPCRQSVDVDCPLP